MRSLIFTICFIVLFQTVAYSQFGVGESLLKRKAEQALKKKLAEKAEEKQKSYDTLTFNYAIAFLDKTESFENKQKGEGLLRTANFLVGDNQTKTDLDEARDIYDFGRLNYSLGNNFLAETYLSLAKYNYETINATHEPTYFKSIGILSLLYNDMGRYALAEEFNVKAKESWLKEHGETSTGYMAELNNSAVIQMNLGNYIEAEQILKDLKTRIKQDGSSLVLPNAILLNNEAILNQLMGRSDAALKLMNDCLEKATEELGENNGTYLQFMTNKAILQQENNQLEAAESTFIKVLELQASRAKFNKKSAPDYAHMQSNLAALYVEKGEYEKGEKSLLTALDIYKNKFGSEHLTTAGTQSDLGNLYRSLGKYEQANDLLQQALYTKERKLAETHPKVVQSQEDVALLYWQTGKIGSAKSYYKRVMETSLDFVKDYFPALSEAEKTKYWEQMKPRFFRFYNFALSEYTEHPDLLDDLLKYRLASKGILLTSSTALQNSVANGENEEIKELFKLWIDQKQQLANAYALTNEELQEQSFNVDSLERAANDTEKALSAQSDAFLKAFNKQNFDYKKIQEKLGEKEVLVEIIQYPAFDRALTKQNYYAYIIFDKNTPQPKVIINKNGDLLEGRYFAYFNNVIQQKLDDQYSYEQYWKPIEIDVSGKSKVYFSPDGIYNQLNVNAFKNTSGKYLIQETDIRHIGHPNDLLFEKKTQKSNSGAAFLLGDPNFNSETIAQLPGTKKEIEEISRFLNSEGKVQKYMQNNATEQNLKQVKSPRILHLASHGFFLEDENLKNNLMGIQLQYIQQNPLLRSGILLTNATGEESIVQNQSFNQNDNGILTAYEAISLDLSNTDMVVLSACETGKGDAKAGEGVYGLQRAFIIAGAKSTIMSMWKVDDTATQKLMSTFYANRKGNIDTPSAFRNAQLAMLNQYKHPYYWGAFMMYSR